MDLSLLEASRTGNVEYLLRLMGENPLLLEAVGLAGSADTPLHVASLCGHLEFAKTVLELKPQFAYELNQDGYTPLHLASVNGHHEIVDELLKKGEDLCTKQGKDKMIPLHLAAVKGKTRVIMRLLSSCPDSVVMKTTGRETALHLAVINNQIGSLRSLLEHLPQKIKETVLNEKDNKGNTILHLAVSRKQYEVLDLLLTDESVTKGVVEVNSKNKSGLTPLDVLLQFPSEAGDIEIESILLKAGAMRSTGSFSTVEPSQFDPKTNEMEDFFKYKKDRDKPSDVRTALLTIAGLMLAATYQAALSPPSGLWQENQSNETDPIATTVISANLKRIQGQKNQSDETNYITGTLILAAAPSSQGQKSKSRQTHKAGTSILAKRKQPLFIFFVFGNSIGFYTAIYTIISLTSGFPMRLELLMSLFAIGSTYVSAMYGIIPGRKTTLAFVIFSTLLAFLLPFILRRLRKMYYREPYIQDCVDFIKGRLSLITKSKSYSAREERNPAVQVSPSPPSNAAMDDRESYNLV